MQGFQQVQFGIGITDVDAHTVFERGFGGKRTQPKADDYLL